MNTPVPEGYVSMLSNRTIKGRHLVLIEGVWVKAPAALRGTKVGVLPVCRKLNESDNTLKPSVA